MRRQSRTHYRLVVALGQFEPCLTAKMRSICSQENKLEHIQEQNRAISLTRDHDQQLADALVDENRAGTTAEEIAVSFRNHMTHSVGKPLELSSLIDKYHALSAAVRD